MTHLITQEKIKALLTISGLQHVLHQLRDHLTVMDISIAADMLTIDTDKVRQYLFGECYDEDLTFKLIAFFTKRIESRHV